MAPAAPALMQAIRAHEHADNHTRAGTLALELQNTYANEPQATEYAKNVLAGTAPKLLLVQVTCDEDCKLDVDGKLQEFLTFFDTPGRPHVLTATFETGSKTTKVQGDAGQTREVRFEAPPPPPTPAIDFSADATQSKDGSTAGRPLPPLVTWIGIGVTGAVLGATIISAIDMYGGVSDYKRAAELSKNCPMTAGNNCSDLSKKANDELDKGQSRELRTNILIGATAFAAVSTGVIALFLTDWSTRDAATHDTETLGLRVEPRPGGLSTTLEGRF
jgi:hypothetical protein